MEPPRSQTASLTPTQQRVVAARGNVLVMAGAGTGKTKTLIERCLDCLEHDGAAMDEMLIVTFTEAAAAEMRERLRRAIESRATSESQNLEPRTQNFSWAEQLARFDLAHIGTLHSFCLKLVREHFYELDLDPRLVMLDEGEARQLANETLDKQFDAHYAGDGGFSQAVQELIQIHGDGRDESIRKLVLQLHHYSQARPDAAGWLARQREKFSTAEPVDWQRWLPEAIADWRDEWLPVLESLGAPIFDPALLTQRAGAAAAPSANEKAVELAAILSRLPAIPDSISNHRAWRETAAGLLGQIAAADLTASYPKGKAGKLRPALGDIFTEAEFLCSLTTVKNGGDPLVEDWSWIHGQMETLLRLAEEFAQKLGDRKRTDGVLDFHDLEQFALKLLWDFSTGQPTAVAATWREKLKFVFVDEYQDINAAQDKIIQGLGRDGSASSGPAAGNRFLVGDVKQSIYRFRLADPKIFREYAQVWRGGSGTTIPLTDNFRSRKGLLGLVNSIFHLVMREEVGGVAYDADAELKFAPVPERDGPDPAKETAARTELLVRFTSGRNEFHEDEGELAGLDDAQREARLVAWRLKQMVGAAHEIFDHEKKLLRPMEWRDVAILLRSPRGRSEIFAKEFERAGIPLAVARGGFFESAEILDLLSLLQLLDNPLQDVPCIAVLRSPLVGLSLDELAEIRLAAKDVHFWTALNRSMELGMPNAETAAKISRFFQRFSRWRTLAKQVSLSQCLDEVLAETLYADWLRAQPRGLQRAANVSGFLQLAQQFDQFQRQGLFRFLKFIEAQQEAEAEPEVPALVTENAVRLMSIHQSKGLEFRVVVLADLAKRFNEQDLRGEIIFDEGFGPSPKVKPPHTGRRYPSLPHWLAQRRQKRELRGEELRLLYVALTRAREHLILTASVTEKNWNQKWIQRQSAGARLIAAAKSFADWLAIWFSNQPENFDSKAQGQTNGMLEYLRWQLVPDMQLLTGTGPHVEMRTSQRYARLKGPMQLELGIDQPELATDGGKLEELQARLEWSYPFAAATRRKAKVSVTALRREAEELDDEAEQFFPGREHVQRLGGGSGKRKLSAPEIGAAHHKFLQHVALEKLDALVAEAERLFRENYLSADEHGALDFKALAEFWNSPLGHKIRAQTGHVRRELPFTARFSPKELEKITGIKAEAGLKNEFVIVQGVADLVVLAADEIWVVDFKTDEVAAGELREKVKMYSPQLKLYAAALEKVFARKVALRALHFLAAGKTVEI